MLASVRWNTVHAQLLALGASIWPIWPVPSLSITIKQQPKEKRMQLLPWKSKQKIKGNRWARRWRRNVMGSYSMWRVCHLLLHFLAPACPLWQVVLPEVAFGIFSFSASKIQTPPQKYLFSSVQANWVTESRRTGRRFRSYPPLLNGNFIESWQW